MGILQDNKELIGVIITSTILAIGGVKHTQKQNKDQEEDHGLLDEVRREQEVMHNEIRDDFGEIKGKLYDVVKWMTRHQTQHDERDHHEPPE